MNPRLQQRTAAASTTGRGVAIATATEIDAFAMRHRLPIVGDADSRVSGSRHQF